MGEGQTSTVPTEPMKFTHYKRRWLLLAVISLLQVCNSMVRSLPTPLIA